MAGVVPMLAYEDGLAAFDRLIRAFGFRGRDRRRDAEGRLMHPGLDTGGGLAMLATPTPDHESPRHHREHCPRAAAWWRVPYVIDSVLLEVEDVDAHCERARAAGARILSEPANQEEGFRDHRAEDLEGHRWMFSGPRR